MLSCQLGNDILVRQRKPYKDVLKSTLKAYDIPVDKWQSIVQDRLVWRVSICKGTTQFERLQRLDNKRLAQKKKNKNLEC